MARRRAKSEGVTTIYWRDIPAQVTASAAGDSEKVLLEDRFQHAIDRAADVAGLTETQAYVSQWRRETASIPEGMTAAEAATAQAAALTEALPQAELSKLVAAGGASDPSSTPAT